MPTVTVRPNATVDASTVSIGGGAGSAHAALSDSTDATYVLWGVGGTTGLVVRYPIPALPGGARWKTATQFLRARHTNVSGLAFTQWYASSVDANGRVSIPQFVTTAAATFAQYASAAYPIALGEVGITTLSVTFSAASGSTDFEIADVWIVFAYATQPTTAVSAPTGTITDRTIVDAIWAHTPGVDGGAQTRYRLKVFSAAEYGADGFNPETSTATYDSGEVIGTATTAPTASLANGTYRAYVKTAQTINSSAHWAEWAYSPFVIDVDTPELLSLSATPQNDTARVRLVATHDTSTAIDWETIEVEASYDGGATWTGVYGAQGASVGGFNTWIGYDYEAPNGVVAVYRARASAVLTGQTLTGAWVQSNSTSWSGDVVWLKHLSAPSRSLALCLRDLPNGETFERTQGVHAVLGRPGYVVTSDVLHTRTGSFSVLTETTVERDELHALLADSVPLLLQIPESVGGFENLYLAVGSVSRSRVPGGERAAFPQRVHTIPFVEIDRPLLDVPPGPLGGETFADALALGGTFATETGTFEELL